MAQYERGSQSDAGFPGASFSFFNPAAMQGLANSVARGNMELVGLASRRARAHLELPKEVMTCHTAAEVGQLGAQFWQGAMQDYMQFNHRMLGLWIENMTAVGQGAAARQAADFANRLTEPVAEAAEAAVHRMSDDPAEPWAWWRTDMKGLRGRNGHSAEDERGTRAGH